MNSPFDHARDVGPTGPIGRDGLLRFCDELNENRKRRGFASYYSTKMIDGKLTLVPPPGG